MATEVKLPRLGQGMESGVIVRWLKAEGDTVKKNEPLYELDTDKVTQEVESELDGVLLEILVQEGEVQVGAAVAVIGGEAGDAEADAEADDPPSEANGAPVQPAEAEPEQPAKAQPAPAASAEQPEPAEESEQGETESASSEATASANTPEDEAPQVARVDVRLKASPLARRIARERGIELASVTPTGVDGRILAEDVEQAKTGVSPGGTDPATDPAVAEPEVVQLTSIRKTIARRLTDAWAAPVFQLGVSADMTETLVLRETLVERLAEGDTKPTVNDVLVKLVATALTRHTAVNAVFTGEEIHRHPDAHVGIAVAAPQGLVVPVIRHANRLTIQEIARARADLVGRARDSKLKLQDLEGGTFSISNLGMYGVEQFTAVLNPPQVAILAVGAAKEQAVVIDGELDVAPLLHLTLTCDHRAIDGADGAEFLQTLVALVEQPALAL